jgi:hypothetical protein
MDNLDLVLMPFLFVGVPVLVAWGYALRQAIRAVRRAGHGGDSARRPRARASLMLALVLLAGVLLITIGPPWFWALVSHSVIRRTEIQMLRTTEIAYAVITLLAALALIPLLAVSVRKRTPARARSWAIRCLALGISILVASALAEAAAVACLWANAFPMPWLPVRFEDRPGDGVVDMVVIGESSAAGMPYHEWFSVPEIVAWKLRAAFPHLTFKVQNLAVPGHTLQAMHSKLAAIKRRPEMVMIYCGHNEFSGRFYWSQAAFHYADETPPTPETLQTLARRISPLMRLIGETSDHVRVSTAPPRTVTRQLVDVPVYTAEQYTERLTEFRVRLGAIVSYCDWIGAQVILVIPPGNDAGFEPNRSFLPRETTRVERDAFAREFEGARRTETTDPLEAQRLYRQLLEQQPRFAESHFRLARLLEQAGEWDEAFRHYVAARDLDGLPMRLPSDFHQVYRDVAARHPRAILVDGPAELHAVAEHGIINDVLFADGIHPSLNGYTVLAQAVLTKLRQRQVLGWSAGAPFPVVTPLDCAEHFQMNRERWHSICEGCTWFYSALSYVRYDPTERTAKAARFGQAARDLEAGTPVDSLGIPGLGARAELGGDARK